ncbi:hypothetical protein FNV43_RR18423 [Rhamnella rubrinervis]|uniref:Uncharacterized protein n=1 Tax=Rhamnella rubrinervis TaxID=2594499 RepID=A0A8K0E692_9ROSA|nr:hypothetical protein FNV43_RR18423 [Rhamnella rubrinervis]
MELLNSLVLSNEALSAIDTPFLKQTKLATSIDYSTCSWRHKCLLFTLLLAFIVLSQGSRLPKEYWKQMLPKKLPTPSSSPSKGTNSVTTSSSKAVEANSKLPYSSDGKV